MRVCVGSELRARLAAIGPAAEATLVADFIAWKRGSEFGHYVFCHDKVENMLHHVHMVPMNKPDDKARWDRHWRKSYLRHRRRSDRYLLYADGGRHGYLLIQIIDDPGAHELRKNKAALETFEIVAENFVFFGVVP